MTRKNRFYSTQYGSDSSLNLDLKSKLRSKNQKKDSLKWPSQIKTGIKVLGVAATVAGTAFMLLKNIIDSNDSSNNSSNEKSQSGNYRLIVKYPDGTVEEDDNVFNTEGDAREYGDYMASSFREGAEILYMSNPGDYPLVEDEGLDYEIIEMK